MKTDGRLDATTGDFPGLATPVSGHLRDSSADERVCTLFAENRLAVYRHVLMLLMNAAEGEDVTQEAFLRLHQALMDGKQIEETKAWVFRVAHNLALDRLRTSKPSNSLSDESVLIKAEIKTAGSLPDPEQQLLSRERFERLHCAIGHLSIRQRECLSLKADGLHYHEIAAILGVSRSTVIENVRRAMNRLVKELAF